MTNDELRETLNGLIRVIRDGKAFYADAANRVDNQLLKALFRDMADSRRSIIEDLNYRVQAHGGKPSQIGTVSGALSEMFAKAKASLANDDDASLIASLEETEARSLESLSDAVAKGLPGPDHRALMHHLAEIRKTHDRMRAMRQRIS